MDHAHFLATIRDDPRDMSRRHVYADWLDDRGDVRGEYVRLQIERSGLSLDDDPDGRLVPVCDRMMELRGEIDDRWLAEMEQPSVMIGNPTPFDAAWTSELYRSKSEPGERWAPPVYGRLPDLDLQLALKSEPDVRPLSLGDTAIEVWSNTRRFLESNGCRTATRCGELVSSHAIRPCPFLATVDVIPVYAESFSAAFSLYRNRSGGGTCVLLGAPTMTPEFERSPGRFTATSPATFLARREVEQSLIRYRRFSSGAGRYVDESGQLVPYQLTPLQAAYVEQFPW